MRGSAAAWRALTVLGAVATAGCAFADVFRASAMEPVVITYVGDTILTEGTTVPLRVKVEAGGTTLPNPRLAVTSSDTSVVAVTAGQDSLRAGVLGSATLTIVFESSMLSGSEPDTVLVLQVRPSHP